MSTRYLKVTQNDGTAVVSAFNRLRSVPRFIARTLIAGAAFPIWRTVGATHPLTGEPVVMRTVRHLNARAVLSIEEVVPTDATVADPETLLDLPLAWVSCARPQSARHGIFMVPARLESVLLLPTGTPLVKRLTPTATGGAAFIVTVRQGDGTEASPLILYNITERTVTTNGAITWQDASSAETPSPAISEDESGEE